MGIMRCNRGAGTHLACMASYARISRQQRSLTALWMDTTDFMSSSSGVHPLRCMALKNICSDGYTQLRELAAWRVLSTELVSAPTAQTLSIS